MPHALKKLPALSYSFLDAYDTCPRQAYHSYLLKERSPPTEATIEGTRVHKILEEYVGMNAPIPYGYEKYAPMAAAVKATAEGKQVQVEKKYGITAEFTKTGFFAPDVWFRGVADVVISHAVFTWIGDWKTGKVKEKAFQVKVFSALEFIHSPDTEVIHANNLWLKDGKVGKSYSFSRDQLPEMIADISTKAAMVQKAFDTDEWVARPGGLCRGWCHVKSCSFNGK